MKPTGPLFKWFGSKWLSSKKLPPPEYDTIIEPFAGGAGYSLRYADRNVILAERNNQLVKLWQWLIYDATESLIREIPIGLPEGTDIEILELSDGQALLLKMWQRTNNVGDCWTISPWGNKPGQWTANTRARVAEEFQCVRHWEMMNGGADAALMRRVKLKSTWLIDPPYEGNYQYKCAPIDYTWLADKCKSLNGQVIVCEAMNKETGKYPTWLPFVPWAERITSRRKKENNHHSKECIWVNNR
jgi:hypothetical protein